MPSTDARRVPCGHPATHEHMTDIGVRVSVCGTHLRMLTKRERRQSDEEKLASWGIHPATPGGPL